MEITFLDMKLEKGYRIIIDDEIIVIRSPGHEEDDDDSVAELTEHDLQIINGAIELRQEWRHHRAIERLRTERLIAADAAEAAEAEEAEKAAKAVTFPSLPKKTN